MGNDGLVALLCTCMVAVKSECKGTRALAKKGFGEAIGLVPLPPSSRQIEQELRDEAGR